MNKNTENLLGLAIRLAAEVHENQVDKSGVCYMLHPLAVMQKAAPDRDLMIVCVLHDAIEDEKDPTRRMKLEFTIKKMFPEYIYEALRAMTHKPKGEETYEEYIERVAANHLARQAKLRDLEHNMDPLRLPSSAINERDLQRWHKYRKAYVRLQRED